MSAEDEVRQASEQYYAALTSLLTGDAGPLMQIWSHSPDVTNIYRHEVGAWKMVHRHTDLNQAEQEESKQLHSL